MIDHGFKKTFTVYSDDEKIIRAANISFSPSSKNPQIVIYTVDAESAIILSHYTFILHETKLYVASETPGDYVVYISNITEKFVVLWVYDFSDDISGDKMGYRMSHENFALSVSWSTIIPQIKIPGISSIFPR
jgi:hypothetical protein